MPVHIIVSRLISSTGLVSCGISTRLGGAEPFFMNLSFNVGDRAENVERNRRIFADAVGFDRTQLAMPMQVHSNVVKCVTAPGSYPSCDGLVTDAPGVFLGISIADCVPIFLLDPERAVIAAIHAGWRGTAARIAESGVTMLVEEFQSNPDQIVAFIGPSASHCCYNVGEEVAAKFSSRFVREKAGEFFVDLKAANVAQLREMGVSMDLIEVSDHCTIHENETFHSFRRNRGRSGRMMAVIGLTTSPCVDFQARND